MNQSKKVVAAFDFDGTITNRDSLLAFIRFALPFGRIVVGFITAMPYLALYQLKLVPNYSAKEKLFKALFKGMPLADFNRTCLDFIPKIQAMLNPEAMVKIKWHQENGHEVIIISASVENWIMPWATQAGIDTVLATQIEVENGSITGKFLSKNCYGPEKANRLLQYLPERHTYELYAYGDSNGDKDLLLIADHKFYRSFINISRSFSFFQVYL